MSGPATTRVLEDGARVLRQRVALRVVEGPDRGRAIASAAARLSVGSAEQNDLALRDPAVSRHHLRVEIVPEGFRILDLGSTNGTWIGELRLLEAVTRSPVELRLGSTRLQLQPLAEEEEVPVLGGDCFGALLGRSASMRELFARLEAVAARESTVLIEGETGTGKELIAEELHRHSPRRSGPFVVVDCGAIPPSLIESELFGHRRGAFTGASEQRAGAFEDASGGTIFLDEVGELELPLQPRLLRVLEQRRIRRLGETRYRPVDVRVVAATHRDLQRAVNQGSFRADLYYRLAVVELRVPPLRERPEDVELYAARFLPELAARSGAAAAPLGAETIREMLEHPWPGNVRELRNFLERLLTLTRETAPALPPGTPRRPGSSTPTVDELSGLPFRQAKDAWIASFDVAYLSRLLERCGQNVAEAARQSGIDRAHLFRLIKRYALRR